MHEVHAYYLRIRYYIFNDSIYAYATAMFPVQICYYEQIAFHISDCLLAYTFNM